MPKSRTLTYWYIFYEDQLLLTEHHTIPCAEQPPCRLCDNDRNILLTEHYGRPCRAVSLANPQSCPEYCFIGLRECYYLLPEAEYQLAGKARELLYWDAGTRYCGRCGAPLEYASPISKRCPSCGKTVWPQLSTAIIVAVTRGPEILLVQSNQFKSDYMGLVAGFVETGESLEECVHREVMEETGLTIRNLQYFQSQPWPYPCGLMVGFKAEYESGELRLQHSELNKGGWFRSENLPAIPGKVSLARRLIDDWLAHQ